MTYQIFHFEEVTTLEFGNLSYFSLSLVLAGYNHKEDQTLICVAQKPLCMQLLNILTKTQPQFSRQVTPADNSSHLQPTCNPLTIRIPTATVVELPLVHLLVYYTSVDFVRMALGPKKMVKKIACFF